MANRNGTNYQHTLQECAMTIALSLANILDAKENSLRPRRQTVPYEESNKFCLPSIQLPREREIPESRYIILRRNMDGTWSKVFATNENTNLSRNQNQVSDGGYAKRWRYKNIPCNLKKREQQVNDDQSGEYNLRHDCNQLKQHDLNTFHDEYLSFKPNTESTQINFMPFGENTKHELDKQKQIENRIKSRRGDFAGKDFTERRNFSKNLYEDHISNCEYNFNKDDEFRNAMRRNKTLENVINLTIKGIENIVESFKTLNNRSQINENDQNESRNEIELLTKTLIESELNRSTLRELLRNMLIELNILISNDSPISIPRIEHIIEDINKTAANDIKFSTILNNSELNKTQGSRI